MAFRRRVYAGFKRRRTGLGRRPYKRRRVMRRRRTVNNNSRLGTSAFLQFRAKKLRGRRLRGILWRDTIAKQHYRSYASGITQAVNNLGGAAHNVSPLFPSIPMNANFWETGGGAIDPDSGTLPTFRGDIVIRGGIIEFGILNYSDTNPSTIMAKVWLVKTLKNYEAAKLPATINHMFDPSVIPEFKKEFGTVIKSWKVHIPQEDQWSFQWRLRTRKVDQETMTASNGQDNYVVLFGIFNAEGVDKTVNIRVGFNLSFTGDAT